MGIIRDLIPLNEADEKAAFLASDDYNPQFTYVRDFTDAEMNKYGKPNKKYFLHAKRMLEQYGIPKRSKPDSKEHDPACSPEYVEKTIIDLFREIGLPELPIHFSEKYNSNIMISSEGMFLRLPIKFSKNSLKHALNHEVQSHYLRRFNQNLQSWTVNTEQRNPRMFRTTEEGLANLHSYIDRDDHIMRKTYLNYYAAYRTHEASFRDIYNELLELGVKESLAWKLVVKQKRGLKDTSKPGGWPKNHVYLEGAVKVWQWLQEKNNDPHQLYWGRIALQDISKVRKLPISNQIIFPSFFKKIDEYYQFIEILGTENQLEHLPVLK